MAVENSANLWHVGYDALEADKIIGSDEICDWPYDSWPRTQLNGSWKDAFWPKTSHGNAGVWKAWKAMKPAFHPSHTPWKSLRGFPHYHGYGDDYHVSEDRQSPPKTLNQSHFHRKGLVNHVPGLKRKGCPGTLSVRLARSCRYKQYDPQYGFLGVRDEP